MNCTRPVAEPLCSLEQRPAARLCTIASMAIAWDLEQRQTRLDQMIEEFHVAKARRLEKQGIARANRAMTRPPVVKPDLPPAKLN